MNKLRNHFFLAFLVLVAANAPTSRAFSESLESALARAYEGNPQLNAERASVRGVDENVPQALSGYRPKVTATATIGEQRYGQTTVTASQFSFIPPTSSTAYETTTPYTYGIAATQTILNGSQTANKTLTAESQVLAAREGLRVMEQTVLVKAATVYMDVLRDAALVKIQQSNVASLREVLRNTEQRFRLGDLTETDVSQARVQLAQAERQLLNAQATLSGSQADYQAIIGVPPENQTPGTPVDRFVPATLPEALAIGSVQSPDVTAAMYGVDIAHLQVKINEGALFPTLIVQASAQQNSEPQIGEISLFTAGVTAQLTVPIYQGGGEYSLIRQSKESVGQKRLNLDMTRLQVRAGIARFWGQAAATKGELQKAKVEVSAAEAALNGVRRELLVGTRTTFDLLTYQQVLVNARSDLVAAQHDRVVSSYNLLAAVGSLSPETLNLPVKVYDPGVHYHQIRDAWGGLRTPNGN